MIYITGDTHGLLDIKKIEKWEKKNYLTKNDYLIIAGDVGITWDSETLKVLTKFFDNQPFTTLFVDGNHENFDILDQYPIEEWNGGKVHMISNSIIHLMRGQVFNIDGTTFFTMGGASSTDKILRTPHISWWFREMPNDEEYNEAMANLEKNDFSVDFIVSHCCSSRTLRKIDPWYQRDALIDWFNDIDAKTLFKHWYFGHYHIDKQIDTNHTCLYDDIKRIV